MCSIDFTLLVSKFDILMDSTFTQLWNILAIFVALLVSKFSKSISVQFVKLPNNA